MSAEFGIIGLAVMGENLALNVESRGYTCAVYNRTTSKVDKFIEGRAKGKNFVGAQSPEEFCKSLKKPRKLMMMVKAGKPVDLTIESILPFLEEGDVIIDGGNSHFPDTQRRVKDLGEKGFLFVGCGVSGGEEGALKGPSLMPGGNPKAWPLVKEVLQAIAARSPSDEPCCDWIGKGGAGHFVKMVHNGIEYGDMQLICEAYGFMRKLLGMSNDEIGDVFAEWNKGDLDSFLIEISRDIMHHKDDEVTDKYTVDLVQDRAGQKGTGKWTAVSALELGMPLTLIGEAVFARTLSAQKEERVAAAAEFGDDANPEVNEKPLEGDRAEIIEDLRQAVFAAKVVSYAQGFVLYHEASREYDWDLKYGRIALAFSGGCIIRSVFLVDIQKAFDENTSLQNLLLAPYFREKITAALPGWRKTASRGVLNASWMPAVTSALAYYDGFTSARLPHNLLQSQRDYFGAHTYERVDKPKGKAFHQNWTGEGGTTTSSTYDN